MGRNNRRVGFLIFIIIIGAITGTFIGDILGTNFEFLKFLKYSYQIGFKPVPLDLHVLLITLGINIRINIMSIIGIILAIIIYRKY
jgi:uncharacterized protein DUF4321